MVILVHRGRVDNATRGVLLGGAALPVAFQDEGDPEDGFRGFWESNPDVEVLSRIMDVEYLEAPGFWMATATWREDHTDLDWGHLLDPSWSRVAAVTLEDVNNGWDGWGWP